VLAEETFECYRQQRLRKRFRYLQPQAFTVSFSYFLLFHSQRSLERYLLAVGERRKRKRRVPRMEWPFFFQRTSRSFHGHIFLILLRVVSWKRKGNDPRKGLEDTSIPRAGERIQKVTKKSGNRGRCRKLSLWSSTHRATFLYSFLLSGPVYEWNVILIFLTSQKLFLLKEKAGGCWG